VFGDNRAMFPMRFSTIFKNRWMAVLWAAGILWFAYDFADSLPQGDAGNNAASEFGGSASSDDTNAAGQAFGN
jgi:hypothetical protein